MLKDEKNGPELYHNLGILFYAVAMADKQVRQTEIRQLRDDILTYWQPSSRMGGASNPDSVEQIQVIFDKLRQEDAESDSCFEEFADFYNKYPEKFSPKIKKLILHTVHNLAASFSRKNKSELIILAKLQLLFYPSLKS